MSRRSFVGGAAFLGLNAVGASMLSGCASGQEKADSETGEASKGTSELSDYVDPIPPVEVPSSWDHEADVVIVGTGGPGLVCAARLAEQGLTCIAIEKNTHTGGSTQEASNYGTCGGAKLHGDWGLFGTPYNVNDVIDFYAERTTDTADRNLLKALAYGGPEVIDWYLDNGADLIDTSQEFGAPESSFSSSLVWRGTQMKDGKMNFIRGQKPLMDFLYQLGVSNGATFLLETPAKALVMEKDRVIGVQAEDPEGNIIYLKGEKAVILAGGGFPANPAMLKKYGGLAGGAADSVALSTGDAIRMAQGCGAGISGIGSFAAMDGGPDNGKERTNIARSMFDGVTALARQPWLQIDKLGNRLPFFSPASKSKYASEFGSVYDCFYHMSSQQLRSVGSRSYVIFDDAYESNMENFASVQIGGRKPVTPDWPWLDQDEGVNVDRAPSPYVQHDWREGVALGMEDGSIKTADTIADLAKELDIDPSVLEQAVDEWNATCQSGEDDPLYYYNPEWLIPIEKPPYHAVKLGATLYGTYAGVSVTPKQEVTQEDGSIIPGLYAAFHTAGGAAGVGKQLPCIFDNVGCQCASGWNICKTILDEPVY